MAVNLRHGGMPMDLGADLIVVVLADEEHRQLPERRHVERFVESALIGGAVAEIAEHGITALVHGDPVADADGDGEGLADDGIAPEKATFPIEQVHGAAVTTGTSGRLTEEFGHHGAR